MDFGFGPSEEAFRQEVRQFLRDNPPETLKAEEEDDGYGFGAFSREFALKVGERGWISRCWPGEYGGQGRPLMEFLVMMEEFAYAEAPALVLIMNDSLARSIMGRGNDFLKREFLPRIGKGAVSFWLGMSEPDAGSDLLALKTEARKDGDYYVINGQKTWSSRAHLSDCAFLICRTNPAAPRHKGLSIFLVDNNTPGVSIMLILNMEGIRHHNNVFFDNVRVHRDYLLGEEDKGFFNLLEGLEFDRFWGRFSKAPFCKAVLEKLAGYMKENPVPDRRRLEDKLAELRVDIEACRLLFYRAGWMEQEGREVTYEGTLGKTFADELGQRLFATGLDIMGLYPRAEEDARWQRLRQKLVHWCRFSIGHTLAGGTSEIIRNTIASRGLAMPQS